MQLTGFVDAIDQQRRNIVNKIISGLQDLATYLCERDECSVACSSMLLGALTRQMHTSGILNPMPTPPFLGYSVRETTEAVRKFTSPAWKDGEYYSQSHKCTLAPFMEPTVNRFGDDTEGLRLGLRDLSITSS